MKLEQQVSSLELSKRLRELGVRQESLFYWTYSNWKGNINYYLQYFEQIEGGYDEDAMEENISAFTVAELGEMLPSKALIANELCDFFCWHPASGLWQVGYYAKNEPVLVRHSYSEDTEADARAKMICYLLENGLTGAEDIKP